MSRAPWTVAASVGVVEALKDQGFCRWNYAIRLIQQEAKNRIRSFTSEAKKLPTQSSYAVSGKLVNVEKLKQFEESLGDVMYLSCWGLN